MKFKSGMYHAGMLLRYKIDGEQEMFFLVKPVPAANKYSTEICWETLSIKNQLSSRVVFGEGFLFRQMEVIAQ